jgi:hypothetical protein
MSRRTIVVVAALVFVATLAALYWADARPTRPTPSTPSGDARAAE